MRRRDLLALAAGAAVSGPHLVGAQQQNVPLIGFGISLLARDLT